MKPLRNIRLTIAFDGSAYSGWQIQTGHPTVQGWVRDSIQRVSGESVSVIGSGRTDAGTHARALVANFHTACSIPSGNLVRALNGVLPRDIRILSAREVSSDFNAQRCARSKIYRYQVYRGAVMPPHLAAEYYHYAYPLDLESMQRGARSILGRHDFASFAAGSGKARRTTIRTVLRSELRGRGTRLWFTVEADGFLHHMVRNIAGTLLELGRGRMSLDEFRDLSERRDRTLAGFTAPAHGLILLRVRY